jgi:hypothetical protein
MTASAAPFGPHPSPLPHAGEGSFALSHPPALTPAPARGICTSSPARETEFLHPLPERASGFCTLSPETGERAGVRGAMAALPNVIGSETVNDPWRYISLAHE